MKKIWNLIIATMVLMFTSDSTIMSAKTKAKDKYKLVFRENFNGTGKTMNAKHWVVPKRQKYRWARQISDSSYVYTITNGKLICMAIPNNVNKKDTAEMLTCAFSTQGKFEFQYGKVEVRLKTNCDEGNFPAVWLLPAEQKGAPFKYGEIDIFETFG